MKVELVKQLKDAGRNRFFKVCIDDDAVAVINKKDIVNVEIAILNSKGNKDKEKTVTCHWSMSDIEIIQEVLFLLRIKAS